MTIQTENAATEVYDLLVDNGYIYNERASNASESEWVREYPSGNSTIVEVVITGSSIEIYRGEFNKDDIQLGPKATATFTHDVSDEAQHIITRKAA